MPIERFSTGDNWNEPYVSGYDNIWEMIIEDREKHPNLYDDDERALLDKDTRILTLEEERRLYELIENWASSRLQSVTY